MTVVLGRMVHIWSRQSRDMQGMFSVWSSFITPPLEPKHLPSCPVVWAKQATFRKQNQTQLMLAKRRRSMGGEMKAERKWEEEKCEEQIAGEWSNQHHRAAAPYLWMAKKHKQQAGKICREDENKIGGKQPRAQAGCAGRCFWLKWEPLKIHFGVATGKGECFGASDGGHT